MGEEAGADIQKDLARTFPLTKRFAGAEGQAALRRVLRAYAALDPVGGPGVRGGGGRPCRGRFRRGAACAAVRQLGWFCGKPGGA